MSADRPLVSVIVPFHNAGDFLREAIDSVFAQTWDSWELLLVDDGSHDGNQVWAREVANAHPNRIRYLSHPDRKNHGPSAARNLGIAQARGDFIAFLDADDVWVPEKLEEQIAVFARHPEVGMVYGRTLIWHSWTGRLEDGERDHFYSLGFVPDSVVRPPRLFLQLLENRAQTPTTCNAILRADVVRAVGGFDESFRRMYEDQEFFARVALRYSVYVAGSCWAKYRQHPSSITARPERRIQYLRHRRPLLAAMEQHLAASEWSADSDLRDAVDRETWAARHPYLHVLSRALRKLRSLEDTRTVGNGTRGQPAEPVRFESGD